MSGTVFIPEAPFSTAITGNVVHAPISFAPTTDMELVRSIITHPEIYSYSTDDGCPLVEDFYPVSHPGNFHMIVTIGDRVAGLWVFSRSNSFTYEVHTAILPWARGRLAVRAAKEMCAWIWENTTCERIWTTVPSFNDRALWFARKSGMVEFGTNPRSFKKNGILWDQVLLGISRPAAEAECQ